MSRDIVERLREAGHRHIEDDPWYSCPMHPEYARDDERGTYCNCNHGLHQDAAAEIERLRAIVDRLPKTADGVPVTPGMRIHGLVGSAYTAPSGSWVEPLLIGGQRQLASNCYSTCEAAEQAAE